MPTKIDPDYKPSDRVYTLLANRYGMTEERAKEFTGHELPAFMMYWEDTGKAKSNWNSTCYNWMARNYEMKKEEMCRQRPPTPQGDIFEKALNGLQGAKPEPPKPVRHRFIPRPETTETMSTDDALAVLRQMTRVTL